LALIIEYVFEVTREGEKTIVREETRDRAGLDCFAAPTIAKRRYAVATVAGKFVAFQAEK
jgi:hypothetical protein